MNRHTAGPTSKPRQVTAFVIEPSGVIEDICHEAQTNANTNYDQDSGQVFIVKAPSGSTDAYGFENGSEEQRWELHHGNMLTSLRSQADAN